MQHDHSTRNTLPAEYAFPAALTHRQVMTIGSSTGATAVTGRMLLACLKLDSAKMMDAWNKEPEAFMELFENAPAAIANVKARVELMECAYRRLLLTGEIAFNGVDESETAE